MYPIRVSTINVKELSVWFLIVHHPIKVNHSITQKHLLLQGPDLANSLIGVLLRFRQEPIAIMAVIEGMFHQVWVNGEDQNLLRFLWWPDGDTNKNLEE